MMMSDDNPYGGSANPPYGGSANPYGGGFGGAGGYGGAPAPAPAAPGMTRGGSAPVGGGDAGEPVFDVTSAEFGPKVMDASRDRPVIVDFWAPWCGPCKQLQPTIEKVVREAKGAVRLAKMNIDEHPDIAGQLGVQSIPAVVAFVDGRPADAFMGNVPESKVRAFIDKLVAAKPTPEMADMAEAVAEGQRLLGENDHGGAAELFGAILQREPGNLDALAGLGQCYVAVGEPAQAQALIDQLPEAERDKAPIAALSKAIALAEAAEDLGDTAELQAKVEADPADHQARFDLATALAAAGRREDAVEQLITIVKADREWNEDGARRQLVDFFEAWGHKDPATLKGRRALSSVLFR